MEATTVAAQPASAAAGVRRKPFYRTLWGQVLLGVCLAIVVGYVSPATGEAMRPLGDGFIRLITMVISLVIFCTVAAGIAGMESIAKVGRVGGKALIYFEVATSLALIIGLLVGALTQPGAGFNADPAALDATAVAGYAGQARTLTITEFLLQIIPTSVIGAFAAREHPQRHPRFGSVRLRARGGGTEGQATGGHARRSDARRFRRHQHPHAPGADRGVRCDGVHGRRGTVSAPSDRWRS